MSYYPSSAAGLHYITYPAGPTPLGATITASGSTNTKGSYAQLVASTGFACNRLQIVPQFTAITAGLQYLLDIAIGGAGSESVIISNILIEGQGGASLLSAGLIDLPVAIPAGTRIAARCQCSTGSQTIALVVCLHAAGGYLGIASFTTYGAVTADSGGTSIDPGGAANNKGAYVELSASTSGVIQSLTLVTTYGGNTAPAGARYYIDIATGAAASEVVLIPDIPVSVVFDGSGWTRQPRATSFLTYIAAGTRLAVRASCSITDATDRVFDAAIYTATAPSPDSVASGLKLSNVAVNTKGDAFAALFDNGYLRIYDGTQPTDADTAVGSQTLLAELRFNATAFGAAVAGVLTANAITQDASANATGTASWFRALQSDGTTVILDGTVGVGAGTLQLSSTSIGAGDAVQVSAFVLTEPKA